MICPFCRAENIEGTDQCANCGRDLAGLDLPSEGKRNKTAPAFINEPIQRLPKHDAPQIGSDYPVALAVRLMQTSGAGCVVVTMHGEFVGLITGWDILHKVAGPNVDLNAVTCGEVMTPAPAFLRDDDTLALALNAMASSRIRHLPILRDGKPISSIDVNDVFRFISPNML